MCLEESQLILLRKLTERRGRQLSIIKEALTFSSDRDEVKDIHSNCCAHQNYNRVFNVS